MAADRLFDEHGARLAEARARAEHRHERQRASLRPLGWIVLAAVLIPALQTHPGPSLSSAGLGVTLALAAYVAGLAVALSGAWERWGLAAQALTVSAIGAAGVALAALQPKGAVGLAASVAVWMAMVRLPLALGLSIAAAVILGVDLAIALNGGSGASVLASTLLCLVLGVTAQLMRSSRENQDRSELLLAELEQARDEQAHSAAVAERARIAGELHDVLAHTLSGLTIQLEGARLLAERDSADPELRGAIARSGELAREGLSEARGAVSAMRGGGAPTIEELDALVERFRRDLHVDAALHVEGCACPLSPEASLALYRGAQEALTNVARYARSSTTTITLSYSPDRAVLAVRDRGSKTPVGASAEGPLAGVGGGNGLAGMSARVARVGGVMRAGPTGDGFLVELQVPAEGGA